MIYVASDSNTKARTLLVATINFKGYFKEIEVTKIKDLSGKKFGRITVLKFHHQNKNKKSCFLCKCDCGKIFVVIGASLVSGNTCSCGCFKQEDTKRRATKHNLYGCNLYWRWSNMIQRTTNPKDKFYKDYGGRGIIVCENWRKNFKEFYDWSKNNGYKRGLTLDRIDVDGNYCPENCRWTTQKQQARNKRNNHILSFNGEKHCISEWSEITGISYSALKYRIRKGWSIEKTMSKNVSGGNNES